MSTIKITNQEKFEERGVDYVELELAKKSNYYDGTVSIIFYEDLPLHVCGHHGKNDFEDEFGFIIE